MLNTDLLHLKKWKKLQFKKLSQEIVIFEL